MKMLSYVESKLFFSLSKICFKTNALSESLAVSTSRPDRFTFEPMMSKFLTSVFWMASLISIFFMSKL